MQSILSKIFYVASVIGIVVVFIVASTMLKTTYKASAPFPIKSVNKTAEESPNIPTADYYDGASAPSAVEDVAGGGLGNAYDGAMESLGSIFGSGGGSGSAAKPEVWGPPAAGEPLPETTPIDVDSILRKMELGNVVFNSPEKININDSAQINLLLSLTEKIEELKKELAGAGERIGETIRVTNRMEAKLSGYNFDITPISPELQAVSKEQNTEWRWEIHPKKEGLQTLHLTLTAHMDVDGHDTARMIKTLDRDIVVSVSNGKKITDWLQTIVKIIVAIGSLAGAILGIIKAVNYLKTGKESK